mmetsp:Transcript_18815/g.63771  ORF Transcript_18815/g.63771 Transcript_18815/m.63771 type:complete len:88 (-) Transcript_18815:1885-2148(-)
MTRPCSSTTILSASLTVERRWAMTTTVRLSMSVSMAACTRCSDSASRALVASSRSSSLGSMSRARAMATRCFWPPESLRPRSPTTWS